MWPQKSWLLINACTPLKFSQSEVADTSPLVIEKSGKSQGILLFIFCGNHVRLKNVIQWKTRLKMVLVELHCRLDAVNEERAFLKKECGVSSKVLEWGPKLSYKSEEGRKFHQIYENVFHPSLQVINDPP